MLYCLTLKLTVSAQLGEQKRDLWRRKVVTTSGFKLSSCWEVVHKGPAAQVRPARDSLASARLACLVRQLFYRGSARSVPLFGQAFFSRGDSARSRQRCVLDGHGLLFVLVA